jgi:hypothetical protein
MFAAYFDAGGTATRGGVGSIAGFVSDVRKWKRFETKWTKILDRESASCFHMTDFVSSQGQFKSWAEQGNRRRRLIVDLVQCARKHTNKAFGGALLLSAYDALNRRYQLQECAGYPYALCGNYCQAADLLAWRTRYGFEQALNPEKLTDEKVQRLKESFAQVWSKNPARSVLRRPRAFSKFLH